MQITAAVARERFGPFTIETLDLADPRPDELLVRIVASGMCQTDQHGRDPHQKLVRARVGEIERLDGERAEALARDRSGDLHGPAAGYLPYGYCNSPSLYCGG